MSLLSALAARTRAVLAALGALAIVCPMRLPVAHAGVTVGGMLLALALGAIAVLAAAIVLAVRRC